MSDTTATLTGGNGNTTGTRCNGILEVKAPDRKELHARLRGKHQPEIPDLLTDSIFNGHAVLNAEVPDTPDDPCLVPHFGHDINCDPGTCDGPGVYRIFGTTLYLAAAPETEVFGRYELADTVQIDICGRNRLTPGTTARTPITTYGSNE